MSYVGSGIIGREKIALYLVRAFYSEESLSIGSFEGRGVNFSTPLIGAIVGAI